VSAEAEQEEVLVVYGETEPVGLYVLDCLDCLGPPCLLLGLLNYVGGQQLYPGRQLDFLVVPRQVFNYDCSPCQHLSRVRLWHEHYEVCQQPPLQL
jgi:hypothetical protein